MYKPRPKANPVTYHTACGCRLSEAQILTQRKKKMCPRHLGPVEMRTRQCMDCDAILELPEKGEGKHRCNTHAAEFKRIRATAKGREYYAQIKKAKAAEKPVGRTRGDLEAMEKIKTLELDKRKLAIAHSGAAAKLRRRWSTHWRGDYCRFLPTCFATGSVKCDGCEEFSWIFKGVDPARQGAWSASAILSDLKKSKLKKETHG